jgi:hypothetical protein
MEVIRYDYDLFMACRTTAICNDAIKERMDKLFTTLSCFKAFSLAPPGGFKSSMDKKGMSNNGSKSHGQHKRSKNSKNDGGNRVQRIIEQVPCRVVTNDPLKILQGLLNKMSTVNASKICNQIETLSSPSIDVIVNLILNQAYKQDSYVKEYVGTIQTLIERYDRIDAEIILEIVVAYLNDFQNSPFFLVIDAIDEKETYDTFCDRVKSKHQSLGKLKVVLELIATLQTSELPYKSSEFITWYMNCWSQIINTTTHLRDLSAELFLDGLHHVIMSSDFVKKISFEECVTYTTMLYATVISQQMPLKLKFKVMNINDLIKEAFF